MTYSTLILSDRSMVDIINDLDQEGSWKRHKYEPNHGLTSVDSDQIFMTICEEHDLLDRWREAKCFIEYTDFSGDLPSELYQILFNDNLLPYLGATKYILAHEGWVLSDKVPKEVT